jgi:NitT/TauT family transport system substrate-binding protein
MKTTSRWSGWAAAALLALGSLGAGLVGCAPPQPPPLRIALNRWIGCDTLWLADQLGFIAAEGLKVEILDLPSIGESCRLFETGQVDVFGGTMMELLTASPRRRPMQAVAVLDISAGLDVILARQGIANLTALKGRRVAVEPGTTDVLLLAAALRAGGMAPDDVELVHVRHEAQAAALREGRVDAVCTYPPDGEALRTEFGLQEVFSSADVPETIIDLLLTDPAVAQTRRAELAALLRANQRAIERLKTDPAALQLVATRQGLPAASVAEQLRGLTLPDLASQPALLAREGLLHRALTRAGATLIAFGTLAEPPIVADLFDPSVVQPTSPPK